MFRVGELAHQVAPSAETQNAVRVFGVKGGFCLVQY
jgi:hypothetical protein